MFYGGVEIYHSLALLSLPIRDAFSNVSRSMKDPVWPRQHTSHEYVDFQALPGSAIQFTPAVVDSFSEQAEAGVFLGPVCGLGSDVVTEL